MLLATMRNNRKTPFPFPRKRITNKPMWQFLSRIGILGAGTLIGQGAAFALLPVLTRAVTPEDYGVFALFIAVLSIASHALNAGYEGAIISAKNKRNADILSGALMMLSLVFSAVIALGVYAIGLGLPDMLTLSLFPALCFVGWYSVFQFRAIRQKHYAPIAMGHIMNNAGRVGLQILSVFIIPVASLALVIGDVVGRMGSMIFVWPRQNPLRLIKHAWHHKFRVIGLFKRYRRFPFFHLPASVIEAAVFWLPVPIVAALYDPVKAGLIAFVIQLYSALGTLVGRSIADVYHGNVHNKNVLRLTLGCFGLVTFVMVLGMNILTFLGEARFEFIFGQTWDGLWPVALSLLPLLIVTGYSQMIARFTMSIEAQNWRLIYQIMMLIFLVFGAQTAYVQGVEFYDAVHIYSVIMMGMTVCFTAFLFLKTIFKKG